MAKNTLAQEVSTGTSESFTEHEMSDPEPHLALLRNRPTLGEVAEPKPAPVVTLELPPEVAPEEFQAELDPEPEELDEEEEAEPEPKPAPRKSAPAKKTARRKTTDDYDFE